MKLFKNSDIENLSIEEVWDLYRRYVNNSQVDLISKFGFGKDIGIKSEKILFLQNQGKKFMISLVV